jgi:3-hydroxy acid dehydrogenase/malonic semialdehyde reductase
MNNLRDKLVFITGASSGIGKACAESFANAGAKLLLAARRIDRLKKFAEELRIKYEVDVKTIKLDVRNYEEVKESLNKLEDDWKKIDILINNAGLSRGLDKIYEGKPENWDEMIDTNIKGLLYITRTVLPDMVERDNGHIINIGSLAGHDVYPGGNVYGSTKFAVNGLTKSFRLDVIGKNIRVSTVDPGLVETEFSIVRYSGDEEKAKNTYKGMTPLVAEDVAEAVFFCASRPAHVNINEIIMTPVAQVSITNVHRTE